MRMKLTKQKTRHSESLLCHSKLPSRHSEFISESQANQILKRVQDDSALRGDNQGHDDSHIKGGYRESRQSTVRTGFTIVEIIFVIAIGGLILVMSFMAISSGQRSKRDAQRKTDLSRINQNIVSWANNANSGIIPDPTPPPDNLVTAASPVPQTPNGGNYAISYNSVTTTACTVNNVYYERTSDRSYKIKICLESGDYTEEH